MKANESLELAELARLLGEMLAVDMEPGRALLAAVAVVGGEGWRSVEVELAVHLARGEPVAESMRAVDASLPAGWRQLADIVARQSELGVGIAEVLRQKGEMWQQEGWRRWQGRARWSGLIGRVVVALCFLPGVVLAGLWPLFDLLTW